MGKKKGTPAVLHALENISADKRISYKNDQHTVASTLPQSSETPTPVPRQSNSLPASDSFLRDIGKLGLRLDIFSLFIPGVVLFAGGVLLGIDWWPHHLLWSQICFGVAAFMFGVKIVTFAVDAKQKKVSERIFFAATVNVVIAIVGAYGIEIIQQHKEPALDPNQVRFTSVRFNPIIAGQPLLAQVHYQNFGSNSVLLRVMGDATALHPDGWINIAALPPKEIRNMEETAWSRFADSMSRHQDETENPFWVLPPLQDTWSTLGERSVTEEEGEHMSQEHPGVVFFMMVEFQWKVPGSKTVMAYDLCNYSNGNQVLLNCARHNGPVAQQ